MRSERVVEWASLQEFYHDHLHLVFGVSTDILALQEAKADQADRVLIMPYTQWQDYMVTTRGGGYD